jgi:hypothetical protein
MKQTNRIPLLLACVLACAALSHPVVLFAEPFTVFSAGDPILEDIRFLARETGQSLTSFTPPLSRDEAALFLNNLDTETLSSAGLDAYSRIDAALKPLTQVTSGFFSLSAHAILTGAARVRTNTNIAWDEYSYHYKDEPAFLVFPVNLYFGDVVQLYIEPSLIRDPTVFDEKDTTFSVNAPYKAEHFDLNIPLRAFIAMGGPWWNFELGRDRASFGVGRTGNMAVSDTPDYYDMARLSFFSSVFKYSLLVSQTPLQLNSAENSLLAPDTNKPDFNDGGLENTTNRYLYLHRLDVRLFKKVSIAFTEGVMVGNSPLELRFLNPLVVFHSFFSWRDYPEWNNQVERSSMAGSLFAFDMDWAVIPSLAVYGQFVMNELSTQYEADNYAESQAPNATGYLLGLEFTHDFSGWQTVLWGEFMYADPYLYALSSPFASFIWMRRLAEVGSKPLRYTWFGHPEGRDTMLFALGSSFSKGALAFSADASFAIKGEHTIAWDWGMGKEHNEQRTPSGSAQRRVTLVLGSVWRILPHLTLSGRVGGAFIFSDASTDNEGDEYGAFFTLSAQLFY